MLAWNAGSPQGTLMKIENDTNTASCPDYYPRARLGKLAKWLQKQWLQIKIKNNNQIGKALALPWRVMDFRSLAAADEFKGRKNFKQGSKTFCCQNVSPSLGIRKFPSQSFQICHKGTDTLRGEMTFLSSCGLDWYSRHLISSLVVSHCSVLTLLCFQHTEDTTISDSWKFLGSSHWYRNQEEDKVWENGARTRVNQTQCRRHLL